MQNFDTCLCPVIPKPGCIPEIVSAGEHMDEFEGFETKAFVGRLLGKGDWTGFMDKIKVELLSKSGLHRDCTVHRIGCLISQENH